MKWALLLIVFSMTACSAGQAENAEKCGVTGAQLDRGIEEVSQLEPYSAREVGQCHLIVDDAGYVTVITPEIESEVENMIAREKVGSGN